jgi:hypothetical protein
MRYRLFKNIFLQSETFLTQHIMSEPIKVILKQKSISLLVDFCLEEKIEFSVKPQDFPDTDWEFNLFVKDIKMGVITGMFLRENRIDIPGTDLQKVKKPAPRKIKEEDERVVAPPAEDAKDAESEDKALF